MIPRNGITGVGPSIFSIFSGSPVAIIICKLLAHCDVPATPAVNRLWAIDANWRHIRNVR